MGRNLPPGVSISDPNAPWNQPDPTDYLPLYCNECDYKATDLVDLQEHEHPEECFEQKPQGFEPVQECLVCNPPDVKPRDPRNGPYCSDHDHEAYQEMLREREPIPEDEIAERYKNR